ncbi:MAG: PDDEXK nuclease domain-containing protein [Bacteroidales bacterium]|nr:PDDEXK nuclease domain-containing protein [Bacteroidales bacterium]
MSNLIHIDEEYKTWINNLSLRFKQSQIKAAIKVNSELLQFYWSLGRDIVELKVEERWGQGVMASVSHDLQSALPDVKGLSTSNLYYIKRFYVTYYKLFAKLPQLGEELGKESLPQLGVNISAEKMVFNELMSIPWNHHKYIMDKFSKDMPKAMFYVHQTYINNWSRSVLLNFLDTDLYERQGKAVTNFKRTLPEVDSDLAQQITKDPYSFDFLSMTKSYNERELKNALETNIMRFLTELGKGFAYVGREYRIMIGEKEKFIDMLFYHIPLHRYVVIEIKTDEFDSDNIGQLGTYVVAVNHQLKTDRDDATIGLLICKKKDNILAQYALEMTNIPLGISEYELSKLVPENFKSSLPSIEEIENELNSSNK